MENIVFLDRNAIRVPLRKPDFPHEWQEYPHTPPERVLERLSGATITINNRIAITAELLDAVPTIRLVAIAATGYDHVDLAACEARGVRVCNVRDWAVSLPEHIFAMTLALRRQLFEYRAVIEAGAWQKSATYGVLLEPLPRALSGSTMGIIGYGALAKRVETIAHGFGMNVVVAERREASKIRDGRVSFDEVLTSSDVLVLLCPLTPETRNLIGTEEIARMRRDALLINCARGKIVDDAALRDALIQGVIAGAATDVLTEEPPRNGNPLLEQHLPNLIVTPHMAWASVESLETLAEQLIGNLEAFVAGSPRNLVTR